ncbi:hypothetical protein Pint_04879 [Pistacia integerrima]|uniref:Uncharacterized protein n=1 Tax=Pistacia integerrima TaxID=434235 RepID=A0ACC0Z935_9ROSI|nr:hypothetical protein Pint_04879 [Pistacia integerrima]
MPGAAYPCGPENPRGNVNSQHGHTIHLARGCGATINVVTLPPHPRPDPLIQLPYRCPCMILSRAVIRETKLGNLSFPAGVEITLPMVVVHHAFNHTNV